MEARTQYSDYVGTAAADRADNIRLADFLAGRGVDTERYIPIGAEFFNSYNDLFICRFICRDEQLSTAAKPHIVAISLEAELTRDQFFMLFKRFKVIVTHQAYRNYEIDEDVELGNRDEDMELLDEEDREE